MYITTTQWYAADHVLSLVVRARGDAAALAPAIRSAIWSVDTVTDFFWEITAEEWNRRRIHD